MSGEKARVKIVRLLLRLVAGIVALVALGVGAVLAWYLVVLPPDVPAPDLVVERTPERIARGEYLANAVFGCMYCHSQRDWTLFAGPIVPGTLGQGGEVFDQRQGLSGRLVAANLTPHHLGEWTDGEIYRAITSGLHRDGYAMFPLMPWDAYIWLKTEDAHAIVAYLRSLPPIASDFEPRAPSLLMRIIANSRVRPAEPWLVDESDPVSRGEYLAVVGGCRFCHTTPAPRTLANLDHENLRGFWGGGMVIAGHGRPMPAANISPDPVAGIGAWTVEQFIARFKAYAGARIPVGPDDPNTEHAWTEYARLSEADLADLYAYLRIQQPRPRPPDGGGAGLPLSELRLHLTSPKPLRYLTQTLGPGAPGNAVDGAGPVVEYALAPPDAGRRAVLRFGADQRLEHAEVVSAGAGDRQDAAAELLFDRARWPR